MSLDTNILLAMVRAEVRTDFMHDAIQNALAKALHKDYIDTWTTGVTVHQLTDDELATRLGNLAHPEAWEACKCMVAEGKDIVQAEADFKKLVIDHAKFVIACARPETKAE